MVKLFEDTFIQSQNMTLDSLHQFDRVVDHLYTNCVAVA